MSHGAVFPLFFCLFFFFFFQGSSTGIIMALLVLLPLFCFLGLSVALPADFKHASDGIVQGQDVVWTPCPVYTNDSLSGSDDGDAAAAAAGFYGTDAGRWLSRLRLPPKPPTNLTADCTTLTLPLFYSNSKNDKKKGHGDNDNETISYFVKRVNAPVADRSMVKGQIWLINGGPGGSGVDMEYLVVQMMNGTGGVFDILIPDHRGTGVLCVFVCLCVCVCLCLCLCLLCVF